VRVHIDDIIRFDISTHIVEANIALVFETQTGTRVASLNPYIKQLNSLEPGSGNIMAHADMAGYFILNEINAGDSWSASERIFRIDTPIKSLADDRGFITISGIRVIPAGGEGGPEGHIRIRQLSVEISPRRSVPPAVWVAGAVLVSGIGALTGVMAIRRRKKRL
jgi:hypothetical protein